MTYFDKNALKLSHEYLRENVKKGFVAIDATAGRGRDTLLLSRLVGESGRVFSFDIQPGAIEATKKLVEENSLSNVTLISDSHHKLKNYVDRADCAVFNLGFLPGGDHSIFSRPETSIPAISSALDVVPKGGFVLVCSYYGGPNGFSERDAVLDYLKTLDAKKYTVLLHSFLNRPNCPPLFIVVEKNPDYSLD